MNRPFVPHRLAGTIRTDGGVDIAPFRRPNESEAQFKRRVAAEEATHQRMMAEIRVRGLTTDLAAGVGTYDGNGNPRGSGWW